MRTRPAAVIGMLAALAGFGPARADSVTLTNGLVYEGSVIRDDSREVTIRGKEGVVSFPRNMVQEVRRGSGGGTRPPAPRSGEAGEPPGESPRTIPGPPGSPEGPDQPPKRPPRPSFPSRSMARGPKEALERALSELEEKALEAWESETTHRVTEDNAGAFKLLNESGVTLFTSRKPASPQGVLKLWRKQNCQAGNAGYFGNCFDWSRLYWHEDLGDWQTVDPRLAAFNYESSRIKAMLSQMIHDAGPLKLQVTVLAAALEGSSPGALDLEEKKTKLRELTQAAAKGWGGGDLLYRSHVLTMEIAWARDPAEKIALARTRRGLLRQLLRIYPQ